MSIGWLNFSIPKPGWLDFGRDESVLPDNELSIEATLPALTANFTFRGSIILSSVVRIKQSSGGVAEWVSRIRASSGLEQAFTPRLMRTAGQPLSNTVRSERQAGEPVTETARSGIQIGEPLRVTVRSDRQTGHPLGDVWAVRRTAGDSFSLGWRVARKTGQDTAVGWRLERSAGQPRVEVHTVRSGAGWVWLSRLAVLREQAQLPPHGWRRPVYVPPTAGKHWGRLNFACPAGGTLNFGRACFGSGQLLIAVQRSYRVINTASLIRVSDSVDIPVTRLSVSLDWASWCWTLSASVPSAAAAALVPAYPAKVRATINGFAWDFIVDELAWNRSFAQYGATLTGRSPAAIYAEPYALAKTYRETEAKTAEQLALQELGPGWALDWQLPMWTVPGGVFQYENLTVIETLNRIAKAAGGWLYADAQDDVLHVVPKWPQKPWVWTFLPDASLPSSYVLSEAQQPIISAAYESIIVSGGKDGIVAVATRAGTGGATVAPAVVDALITDMEPAQGRAIQELADLWPMKRYTLALPLQATPAGAGLLVPGTTFDFLDGEADGFRGVVSGVSIDAGWNNVQQKLEVLAP